MTDKGDFSCGVLLQEISQRAQRRVVARRKLPLARGKDQIVQHHTALLQEPGANITRIARRGRRCAILGRLPLWRGRDLDRAGCDQRHLGKGVLPRPADQRCLAA